MTLFVLRHRRGFAGPPIRCCDGDGFGDGSSMSARWNLYYCSLRRENGAPKVPSVSVNTWKQIHGGGGRTGRLASYLCGYRRRRGIFIDRIQYDRVR